MKEILVVEPCIYTLSTGITLFSEGLDMTGDDVVFDGDKTAILLITQDPMSGKQGIQSIKMKDSHYTFFARTLTVKKSAIIAVAAPASSELLKNCRSTLSGLILQ